MGQTLQASLHMEASGQTAATSLQRGSDTVLYKPDAVIVGGGPPLAQDLSRASRTRFDDGSIPRCASHRASLRSDW